VQTLHVLPELAGHVALALEDTAGEMVLPTFDFICLEGQPASSIENFDAARQLPSRSVTVSDTGPEFDETDSEFDETLDSESNISD